MNEPKGPQDDDRLMELLAEEAEHGLDAAQDAELTRLLDEAGREVEDDELALAAAAAYRVYESRAGVIHEPMPAALSKKIIRAGEARAAAVARKAPATLAFRTDQSPLTHPALGWLAAAAVLALAATAWIVMSAPEPAPGYADQLNALLAGAPDTTTTAWAPSDDPVYGQVTGDVVWSDARQAGFMRLAGLPVNDPAVRQYQLWIVDPDVDAHPVDGGVFDITGTGEVIVPIDAKLVVDKPTVFAITVEKPGGVVVSAGPLRVVAAVGT